MCTVYDILNIRIYNDDDADHSSLQPRGDVLVEVLPLHVALVVEHLRLGALPPGSDVAKMLRIHLLYDYLYIVSLVYVYTYLYYM